ncbi:MAG: hypothetical protein HYU86_05950 [Chloroflexi bacterium]|nr:hypothetical protein [Chloroflexota bacterium]
MAISTSTLKRLELLEKEIAQLRRLSQGERLYKSVELDGAIKGIRFTEDDIAEAKRSLFGGQA